MIKLKQKRICEVYMKFLKKTMCCVIALLTAFGGLQLFGCAKEVGEEIDVGKTTLNVSVYNGGVGIEWLKKIKTDFELLYADNEYEIGKKGVQVRINDHKEQGDSTSQLSGITVGINDVFFTDKSNFQKMLIDGLALDISEIVTSVSKFDGKIIASKLAQEQNDYFKYNGKYYALPHVEDFGSINFNRHVFDEYELYFAKGGCPSEYCSFVKENNANANTGTFDNEYEYTNYAGEKSAGPDGKYGTYDDGLPATYREFFVLCDHMEMNSVTPFIWSGKYIVAYMGYLLGALFADDMGETEIRNFYNYQANTDVFNERSSEAMENALNFVTKIMKGSYCDGKADDTTGHSNTAAQQQFIFSEKETDITQDGRPIAMFIDGNYWECEAALAGYVSKFENKYTIECSYGFMPVPKVDESRIGEPLTVTDKEQNIAFIASNVPEYKKQLALDFLQYCYSDEKLVEFTSITGLPKALQYEVSADKLSQVSDYSKSLWDVHSNAKMVYAVSGSPAFRLKQKSVFDSIFSAGDYAYALIKNEIDKDGIKSSERIAADVASVLIANKNAAARG